MNRSGQFLAGIFLFVVLGYSQSIFASTFSCWDSNDKFGQSRTWYAPSIRGYDNHNEDGLDVNIAKNIGTTFLESVKYICQRKTNIESTLSNEKFDSNTPTAVLVSFSSFQFYPRTILSPISISCASGDPTGQYIGAGMGLALIAGVEGRAYVGAGKWMPKGCVVKDLIDPWNEEEAGIGMGALAGHMSITVLEQ